jgi:alginate O-acetyltransferase complex protein AlgI
MAIGLGKMFGFDFPENFNYPYVSRSIKEFWRRWHISLSSWFRDYLYISLGGNRVGATRTYINLFIVFFVTGLWHGANWSFVIWGLYHGVFIVLERVGLESILLRLNKPLRHLYTLLVVAVGWVIFRAETLPDALNYLNVMFVPSKGTEALTSYLHYFYGGSRTWLVGVIAILFSVPSYRYLDLTFHLGTRWVFRIGILTLLFGLSVIYVVSGSYSPFIYFRF